MKLENKQESNNQFENFVTIGLSEPLIDLGVDYAEIGVDAIFDNDIVKEIPVVRTLLSMIKGSIAIKERHFAQKFLSFLQEYHSGNLSKKEKYDFLVKFKENKKYKEKVTSLLITTIDRYYDCIQSQIASRLFIAHVKGLIEWDDYVIMCGCLDKFHPFSIPFLDELEKEELPYHKAYLSGGDARAAALISCAFAYQWGTHFYVTTIGILTHQYGIKGNYLQNAKSILKNTWLKDSI